MLEPDPAPSSLSSRFRPARHSTGRAPDHPARRASTRIAAVAVAAATLLGGCSILGTSPGATATTSPATGSPAASASAGPTGSPTTNPIGGAAADLQATYEAVVRDVGPSVVVIETSQGLGSGVVFDDQGHIVTNAHVVGSATTFKVATSSGERLDATLVGVFTSDDLAVIKVTDGSLQPATFGNSDDLTVGQIVLAIGNPLGLQSSVTDGIISALGRTVSEPTGAALPGVIQTSASINPGNSGGALVDLSGEVIGIPTLTATDPQLGGAAPGIGFAIPSSTAKDIASQLIANGKVVASHRAYLGIRGANVSGAAGVLVFSLDPGGPAATAGLPTDVLITSIAGKPTPDLQALAVVLAQLSPGQVVDVRLEHRDGSTSTVKVTLGQLPG